MNKVIVLILVGMLLTSCVAANFNGLSGNYGPSRSVTPEEATQSYVCIVGVILLIVALEIISKTSYAAKIIVSIIALFMAICFLAA